MAKKTFPCKIEELPVIAEFVISSARKDLTDFSDYSTLFTSEYFDGINRQIDDCKQIVNASVLTKELKSLTRNLHDSTLELRTMLNKLEGYFKLAKKDLDIAVADAGIRNARLSISKGNTEGVINNSRNLLVVVKRNETALAAKGMQASLITEIESKLVKIESLNLQQNELISRRGRQTKLNTETFNELWESLKPILDTAKAIYRGSDTVKLNDYTVSRLRKRINAEGKRG